VTPHSRTWTWTRPAIVGLVAVLLLGIAVLPSETHLFGDRPGKLFERAEPAILPVTTSTPVIDLDNEARIACEQFVQAQLRAPATATFSPRVETRVTHTVRDDWVVNGWIDSQNGFGAMLRSEYDCATARAGDSWQLVGQVVLRPA
jgi:hypothetical protein